MSAFIMFIVVAAALILVFTAMSNTNGSKQNQKRYKGRGGSSFGRASLFTPWPSAEPPAALGVPQGHPARPAAERLEAALGLDLESRVKDRLLKQFPRVSDDEWKWTWFELKRYFLMCGVLRSVPMYSKQVDAAWHEMLMFTREYEQFCSRFIGHMIHHAPHEPGVQPEQGERAWFDWVYAELFAQTPASGRIWGAFYQTRMAESRLDELENRSVAELRHQLFHTKAAERYEDLSSTVDYLIDRVRKQLLTARESNGINDKGNASIRADGYDSALGSTGILSGLLIFHSMNQPNEFASRMDQAQTEDERKANSSSDSLYSCSGSSQDDRADCAGDSGSDGSSSCGSGGSSCGGGGD